MASVATVTVDLEPSEKVKELIAAEVEKQLAGRFARFLQEIEARVQIESLAGEVAKVLAQDIRLQAGTRDAHLS